METAGNLNEAGRVFDLIDKLMLGEDVQYRENVDPSTVWRANFKGQPSYRHANRIAILREFLEGLLPGQVETVAAHLGSVVVEFAPVSDDDPDFGELSLALAESEATFHEIAARIGLRSLSFGERTLTF